MAKQVITLDAPVQKTVIDRAAACILALDTLRNDLKGISDSLRCIEGYLALRKDANLCGQTVADLDATIEAIDENDEEGLRLKELRRDIARMNVIPGKRKAQWVLGYADLLKLVLDRIEAAT